MVDYSITPGHLLSSGTRGIYCYASRERKTDAEGRGRGVLNDPVTCIFCLKEKQESEEHVFPDSIGGLLVIFDVCKGCNNYLGSKVDTHLVNHPLMDLARLTKKIKGKSGKIPNPLGKGTLDGESNVKVHYRFNSEGEPESVYVVSSQTVSKDGKSLCFSVDATDEDKLPNMINKSLKRRGLPAISIEEMEANQQKSNIPNPKININLKVDMNSFRKAIIKIVYEITYYWLGKSYLDDIMGDRLRSYILSDSLDVEGIYGNADIVDKSSNHINPLRMLSNDDSHTATLIIDGCKLYCYVNIFDDFEGYFLVSENAEEYSVSECKFLENNVIDKTIKESNYKEELLRRGI